MSYTPAVDAFTLRAWHDGDLQTHRHCNWSGDRQEFLDRAPDCVPDQFTGEIRLYRGRHEREVNIPISELVAETEITRSRQTLRFEKVDHRYAEAVELAARLHLVSKSNLQRSMEVDFTTASILIERMVAMGLLKHDEFAGLCYWTGDHRQIEPSEQPARLFAPATGGSPAQPGGLFAARSPFILVGRKCPNLKQHSRSAFQTFGVACIFGP